MARNEVQDHGLLGAHGQQSPVCSLRNQLLDLGYHIGQHLLACTDMGGMSCSAALPQ
jgi:hypothetical protein